MWLRLRGCQVDLHTGEVQGDDNTQRELSETERRLLSWFSEHPGEAVSRQRLLDEVWSYARGVVSRTVDTTMRRLRQKLERDPSRPDHFHTIRGVGYRFTPLLTAPAQTFGQTHAELPAPITPLIGRQDSLSRMDGLLQRRRLITITGPGGVGKTRLLLAVGHRQRGRFSDVLFCDLSTLDAEDGVLAAMGGALSLPGVPSVAAIHRALQDRQRPLLLIDNAEHLLAALAPMVADALQSVAALVVVVTSRQRLKIRGEALLELPPLPRPDALTLLAERITDATGHPPPPEQALLLGDLVDALDRLPLAIELAAARMDTLTAAEILDQLADRFALLRAQWVDANARQATLWATIEWSWSQLSANEQAMLSRLALIRGTFSNQSAQVLFDAAPLPDTAGPALLAALRQKSLVQQEGGRFRLLEAVRDFALQHLSEQRDQVALTWSDWLVETSAHHHRQYHRQPAETLAWIRQAQADLLAVWDRHQHNAPHLAARALLPLWVLIQEEGPSEALAERYTRALEMALPDDTHSRLHHTMAKLAASRLPEKARVHAQLAAALAKTPRQMVLAGCTLVNVTTDVDEKLRRSEALVADARKIGGDAMLEAAHIRASVLYHSSDSAAAIQLLEEGLAYSEANGWTLYEALFSATLGGIRSREGRSDAAKQLINAAIDLYAQQNCIKSQGWALNQLGIFHLERNQNPLAETQFHRALRLLRRVGAAGISAVVTNLAAVYHQDRKYPRARALYHEALVNIIQTDRPFEVALTRINLAGLELSDNVLDAAEQHLIDAQPLLARLDSARLRGAAMNIRGLLRLLQQRFTEAIDDAKAGAHAARRAHDLRMESVNLSNQALGHLLKDQPEQALALLLKAEQKLETLGDTLNHASVCLRLGVTRLRLGEADAAEVAFRRSRREPRLALAEAIYRGEPHEPDDVESRLAAIVRQHAPR
ncbi:MAG: winged helix-turn-helix domain-containing protein [Myxococcota bacterium]